MTFPPRPEQVSARLRPFLDWVLPALDVGAEHANWYEQETGFDSDPHLYAFLVRNSLRNQIGRLAEDAPMGLSLKELPLCGIELHNPEYRLRILKASYKKGVQSGELEIAVPDARNSAARRSFFFQPAYDLGNTSLPIEAERLLKLVMLWDVDGLGRTTTVSLALPKVWNSHSNRVELWWRTGIYPDQRDVQYDNDIAVDEIDLDVSLDDIDVQRRGSDEEEDAAGT